MGSMRHSCLYAEGLCCWLAAYELALSQHTIANNATPSCPLPSACRLRAAVGSVYDVIHRKPSSIRHCAGCPRAVKTGQTVDIQTLPEGY